MLKRSELKKKITPQEISKILHASQFPLVHISFGIIQHRFVMNFDFLKTCKDPCPKICFSFTSPISLYSTKTEKEKKKQAQEAGMVRAEISGAEVRLLVYFYSV